MTTSTRNILLTGAGFTKNFGGLLGTEVWDKLWEYPEVRKHTKLVDLLHRCSPDFETAYKLVQDGDCSVEERLALTGTVESIFSEMDSRLFHFSRWGAVPCLYGTTNLVWEFSGDGEEKGYFFTLNQDRFIEHRIMPKTLMTCRNRREIHLLGIRGRPGVMGAAPGGGVPAENNPTRLPTDDELTQIRENSERHERFCYVKLHGSTGWVGSDGSSSMVIGGGKVKQIEREPLLKWYAGLFRQVLLERRHRLLIIGYSFRDPHINKILAEAIAGPGLDLAVISPTPWTAFFESLPKVEDPSEQCEFDIIRDSFREPGARHFHYYLRDIFPPEAQGEQTGPWQRIREYLQEA